MTFPDLLNLNQFVYNGANSSTDTNQHPMMDVDNYDCANSSENKWFVIIFKYLNI
jgi:hypothetical protein